MSCPQCGFANPPNSTRCQKCGAGLAAAQQPQPQPPAAQQQYAPQPQQQYAPPPQQQYAPQPQPPVQVIVQQPQAGVPTMPPKSKVSAALLAFFLGALGVHNFYLGYTGRGIAQLILTLTIIGWFISGTWAFIEFIMILCGGIRDPQGRPLV
tara:strand:+ start:1745 stop:2200 length:456 start_codon:yes stop_codon:yes gene_type:complete